MLDYAALSVGERPGILVTSGEIGRALNERARASLAPTIILHPADDPTVPVANALIMFQALKIAQVPVEMRIFLRRQATASASACSGDRPDRLGRTAFVAWLRRRHSLSVGARRVPPGATTTLPPAMSTVGTASRVKASNQLAPARGLDLQDVAGAEVVHRLDPAQRLALRC